MEKTISNFTNVLVIGCGGAGLRAAIQVKLSGLKVKVLGKRNKNDAHTSLAAGGINASLGNLDQNDSWEQHFIDTYNEGYGIGDPSQIEILAKEAPTFVKEIDNWGADFKKLKNGKLDQRFFGAHTYRRTCYSGDYTGQSILKTLLKKSKSLNIPIDDQQYVTDLLVKEGQCFGAISFNVNTGLRSINLAHAIILCTGGHTQIWKKNSSRKFENNGDGIYLGLKAGCCLIDMEMVQFHPTGMVLPEEMSGTLVTEAVRGEGGRLLNVLGERFMKKYDKRRMELSTRDKVALANYTEIIEGRGSPNGGIFLDITHKKKDYIIEKLPKIYKQFLDSQNIDISKELMEVAPTAHYSMGGIKVNAEDHQTDIKGLFAAGEVAGGLHGANRLGGNSLSEILIFGARSGSAAANFSLNLKSKIECEITIKNSLNQIDSLINFGKNKIEILEEELQNLMWINCGVVKDEKLLLKGLQSIAKIKEKSNSLNLSLENKNYKDLVSAFNLKASLIAAEATLLSSLSRRESRGAHQRSDFPNTIQKENVNYITKLIDNSIKVFKENIKDKHHLISDKNYFSDDNTDFSGKLLE